MTAKKTKLVTDGMRTSEFVVSGMLPMIIMLLNHFFGWGITPEAIGAGSIGTAGYAVSRGMAK